MDTYLKSFVIGSSSPVFLPFFYGVTKLSEKGLEGDPDVAPLFSTRAGLESYMFAAPLYFGAANMLRIFLRLKFKLSEWNSYLLMSQLSPAFVSAWVTIRKSYSFTEKEQWYKQYALLWAAHGFTWLVTIPQLEKRL